ncbi:4-diphosphocytidyl-2-C-methyl-D-erythritol kinase [Haloactinospora alba]|uniref:4-diphosphocytidyl-2-C-methyl-D-erythritol kinase n=1 Tax=Haloactinospora alba TaxID=405555 RepID=A0A543NER1_9ACTN|nr:4-(cytidine 5'-diphospho)-2-C-methyl-D-erythritol kinase [Haloactinospora alba]TQN30311.1 4-diphosphocytidyl-2-C-methyl-D-erythritol kinase [Haloactinospora alba]
MNTPNTVTVRVPAKVNLQLAVGPARDDGYHDLVNVFHAVSLFDEVTVTAAGPHATPDAPQLSAEAQTGPRAGVPLDGTNLASRAARLAAGACDRPCPGRIHLRKNIPVAGGMAGGSADAAAVLVACNTLWNAGLSEGELGSLAAELGSDVAFPLLGGTAVGTGRGEQLTPLDSPGRYHWVFALSETGLSTGAVFGEYDRLRPDAPAPRRDPELTRALAAADAAALGAALSNDLQRAALSLRPDLEGVLRAGRAAGASGALVSGSGPTCAFLAGDEGTARALAAELERSGACQHTVVAHGHVAGATVVG